MPRQNRGIFFLQNQSTPLEIKKNIIIVIIGRKIDVQNFANIFIFVSLSKH